MRCVFTVFEYLWQNGIFSGAHDDLHKTTEVRTLFWCCFLLRSWMHYFSFVLFLSNPSFFWDSRWDWFLLVRWIYFFGVTISTSCSWIRKQLWGLLMALNIHLLQCYKRKRHHELLFGLLQGLNLFNVRLFHLLFTLSLFCFNFNILGCLFRHLLLQFLILFLQIRNLGLLYVS